MVLGFKKQFVPLIKSGTKIHTIREDKHNRWKKGMTMHMATGVRTKKYKQFAEKKCKSIQYIIIDSYHEMIYIEKDGFIVKKIVGKRAEQFAFNDGFDSIKDFFRWFNGFQKGLKLIHWTDKKY